MLIYSLNTPLSLIASLPRINSSFIATCLNILISCENIIIENHLAPAQCCVIYLMVLNNLLNVVGTRFVN